MRKVTHAEFLDIINEALGRPRNPSAVMGMLIQSYAILSVLNGRSADMVIRAASEADDWARAWVATLGDVGAKA